MLNCPCTCHVHEGAHVFYTELHIPQKREEFVSNSQCRIVVLRWPTLDYAWLRQIFILGLLHSLLLQHPNQGTARTA